MASERWQRIGQIYEAALERAPAERESFLDSACSGDETLRREVERLIGTARANDLQARRLVAAKLYDEAVVRKLFTDIVPRYQNRAGGFTRTVKLMPRRGDGAPMAQIELIP